MMLVVCFFFSSRRRHTRLQGDWSSDVCSSDLIGANETELPDTDFPVSGHHYVTWKAGVGTSHRLSRRAWVDADASYSTRREIGRASCRERVEVAAGGERRGRNGRGG